jgi:hypothetical protein
MYYTLFHTDNNQYLTDNIQSQCDDGYSGISSEYSDFGFQTFSLTDSELVVMLIRRCLYASTSNIRIC